MTGATMKVRLFATSFAVCCAAMILAAMTVSPQDPAEMEKMFADAIAKYGAPAAEHEMLAQRAGHWTAEAKMWMAPGAPPEVHSGVADMQMVMGGRFLMQSFKMTFNGMDFEGAGLIAYDRMRGEYQSIWIDNMSTAILWTAGKEKNGEVVMKGKQPDIMAGRYVPLRTVERTIDDDSFVFEMYMAGEGGNDFKSMEITYTRGD
jgi:hypothetical protein